MAQTQTPKLPDDAGLKRLAMGIFLQMPTDLDEAQEVMAHLAEILKWHRGTPYFWAATDGASHHEGGESDVVEFKRRG